MMKPFRKGVVIGACLLVLLAGCSTNSDQASRVSNPPESEEHYTKITNGDGFDFYVDDEAIQVAEDEQADAKKITDLVESYVMRVLYSSYNGRIGVVDGDTIAAPGLEAEMNARIAYLAEKYKDQDFSAMDPYLSYQVFEIKDDAAKVIVSFEMRNTKTGDVGVDNHEGYVFIKEGNDWKLINNIVDTGKGGAATLEALAKSDDPEAWRTTYSYEQLKRSDYEDAPDYSYYLNEQFEVDPQKMAEE